VLEGKEKERERERERGGERERHIQGEGERKNERKKPHPLAEQQGAEGTHFVMAHFKTSQCFLCIALGQLLDHVLHALFVVCMRGKKRILSCCMLGGVNERA